MSRAARSVKDAGHGRMAQRVMSRASRSASRVLARRFLWACPRHAPPFLVARPSGARLGAAGTRRGRPPSGVAPSGAPCSALRAPHRRRRCRSSAALQSASRKPDGRIGRWNGPARRPLSPERRQLASFHPRWADPSPLKGDNLHPWIGARRALRLGARRPGSALRPAPTFPAETSLWGALPPWGSPLQTLTLSKETFPPGASALASGSRRHRRADSERGSARSEPMSSSFVWLTFPSLPRHSMVTTA